MVLFDNVSFEGNIRDEVVFTADFQALFQFTDCRFIGINSVYLTAILQFLLS